MAEWYYPNGSTVAPHITDDFGPGYLNGEPRFHYGDDVVGFTWNRSVSAGMVVFVGYESGNWGGGLQVWVNHGDGIQSRYKHNATGTIRVERGDSVLPRAILGQMGSTGLSSAIHLHYEIRINGIAVRPSSFIASQISGGGSGGGGVTTTTERRKRTAWLG
jgi:murein DD-endopeptidase MepM/ murein hydrolase activator NlpD